MKGGFDFRQPARIDPGRPVGPQKMIGNLMAQFSRNSHSSWSGIPNAAHRYHSKPPELVEVRGDHRKNKLRFGKDRSYAFG